MGAIGVVYLANDNPELFDAAIGISGCYSTLDDLGRSTVELIVGSRGGDVENMWGEFGNDTWRNHDVTANPSGLRDTAVYLLAAPGAIGEADPARYDGEPFYHMISGVALERGAWECTRNLVAAMTGAGMDHHTVDYLETGAHNWSNYSRQLQPAWDAVKHALYYIVGQ